jgi:hypothetical protein
MSRMICLPSLKVKPTRKTARPSAPFGQGIAIPYKGRQMPYTQADLDEAAQMFAGSPEPDWDALAAQREWEDLYEKGLLAPVEFGHCAVCSTPYGDLTPQGLCDACDIHACETSSVNRY